MTSNSDCYTTQGGIHVSRSTVKMQMDEAIESVLSCLDSQRGGLLVSSYEYPGRYKRWAIGFVNPPLELTTRGRHFTLKALNERGRVLLSHLVDCLYLHPHLQEVSVEEESIVGSIQQTTQSFTEEERSKQPSVFSVIREISQVFYSGEDEKLGLYGAFGYDLVFQFESIAKRRDRSADQRDLLLYLPDELFVVDYYLLQAYRYQYEFETEHGSTQGMHRTGEFIDYRAERLTPERESDHVPGEYAKKVEEALEYFRRGDLFEVVPSQNFYRSCVASPTDLFRTLQQINPSPYGFLLNLGGEYLIGASPEMFVRVEGKYVETCPISGTIGRGVDAIGDAAQIRLLLNSDKDAAELTMCTDVDRNDKSRICKPGSVRVIGRRQIEMYSHLIHTVDHVEGILRPEFDALDAFLTHAWAVTVTGAPKRSAMQFIEEREHTPRRWYGGAIGYLAFNGDINTGLTLRTMRLKDSIAEVRVGATVLYDSDPVAEEQETLTKAAALFQTLSYADKTDKSGKTTKAKLGRESPHQVQKRVLLIDYEDSFVHTLANYLRQAGAIVTTLRHGFSESMFDRKAFDLVVFSPGPGKPRDFGVPETVISCVRRELPVFGVCLGLQGIVEAFGGELGILDYPQHGKTSRIDIVEDSALFQNVPKSFEVGRYHSLYAQANGLPDQLKITALSEDGVIMAIEHKTKAIAAVQFHPESIMTLGSGVGLSIIKNVIQSYAKSSCQSIQIRRRAPHQVGKGYQIAASNTEPRHILEEIIWHKEQEVAQMQASLTLSELKTQVQVVPPAKDFILALQSSHSHPSLIAEVKKASPSKGIIRADFDPVNIARSYERAGATCLSVLTDSQFFQGSFDNLRSIRRSVSLPLLCKDFIIDIHQIYLARAAGADAVLLIVAILSDRDLQDFLNTIHSLGMTALVEVHTAVELNRALSLTGLRLLGINNRDLKNFTVDLETTEQLIQQQREQIESRGIKVVSESGLSERADLERVAQAGARAVLIGESLVKQLDIEQAVCKILNEEKEVVQPSNATPIARNAN
jgi:anthranilate synthase